MNEHYGRWTVLQPDFPWRAHDRVPVRCQCGTHREVTKHKLTSGGSQSCGCLHSERSGQRIANYNRGRTWPTDLAPESDTVIEPGARIGRWTVVGEIVKSKHPIVACECDCGTVKDDVNVYHLRKGRTKSCGCLRRDGARAIHAT